MLTRASTMGRDPKSTRSLQPRYPFDAPTSTDVADLILERLAKEMRDNAALRIHLRLARERIDQLERERRGK